MRSARSIPSSSTIAGTNCRCAWRSAAESPAAAFYSQLRENDRGRMPFAGEPMINKPMIVVAAVVVVAASGAAYYLHYRSAQLQHLSAAAPAAAAVELTIQHPVPQAGDSAAQGPLPALGDSDPAIKDALGEVARSEERR